LKKSDEVPLTLVYRRFEDFHNDTIIIW